MQTEMFSAPTGPLVGVFVSHETGRLACEFWHYSRVCPPCQHIIGFYRGVVFDGVIAFRNDGLPDLVDSWEQILGGPVCELARIALRPQPERPPTTHYISKAVKMIKSLALYEGIYTYADDGQGHTGGVYRAANFQPCGYSLKTVRWTNGKRTRGTTAAEMRASGYEREPHQKKWRYAYGLTRTAKRKLVADADNLAAHPQGIRPTRRSQSAALRGAL